MKIAVISKDTEYASMLEYELRRRGFDALRTESYGGADVALVDLDSLDGGSSVFGGKKIITFSYGDLATLRRPFSMDALADILVDYEARSFDTKQKPMTDPQSGRVFYKGKEVPLSPLEFSVFNAICSADGNVVSFVQLLSFFDDAAANDVNRLRVCINSIRSKLKPVFGYDPIANQKGDGYKLNIV